ncbi:MAG TPA: HEAT repeat domain-containing protein [Pirellulaceae bacterium]|jgi:hypothetical protein
MRFRLRTLLILASIAPPLLAIAISTVVVFMRSKSPPTTKGYWPGMMLTDFESGGMIHIFSDGRRESGVPGLIGCLDHESPGIRRSAADWLAAIGSPAKDALPALKKLQVTDEDERVRDAAAKAIDRINTPAVR